jgi:hypothetical protein
MRSNDVPDLTGVVLAAAYDGEIQLSGERRENARVIELIEQAMSHGLVARQREPGTAHVALDARDPATLGQVVRLRITVAGEPGAFWTHVAELTRGKTGAFTIGIGELREAIGTRGIKLRDEALVALLAVADPEKLGWRVERTAGGDGFDFAPR